MNDRTRHIEDLISNGGLPGFVDKLDVAGQDVYVKTAFCRPPRTPENPHPEYELVYVDITLSAIRGSETFMATARDVRMEATKTDNARSMIEMLCRQVNELLQSGMWTWETFAGAWAGSRFEPAGSCKFPTLLVGEQMEEWGGIVQSPLDAVAKLIQARMTSWLARLPKEEAEDGKHGQEPEEEGTEGQREGERT